MVFCFGSGSGLRQPRKVKSCHEAVRAVLRERGMDSVTALKECPDEHVDVWGLYRVLKNDQESECVQRTGNGSAVLEPGRVPGKRQVGMEERLAGADCRGPGRPCQDTFVFR